MVAKETRIQAPLHGEAVPVACEVPTRGLSLLLLARVDDDDHVDPGTQLAFVAALGGNILYIN